MENQEARDSSFNFEEPAINNQCPARQGYRQRIVRSEHFLEALNIKAKASFRQSFRRKQFYADS
jgi:hypothetical protein